MALVMSLGLILVAVPGAGAEFACTVGDSIDGVRAAINECGFNDVEVRYLDSLCYHALLLESI
jgi:hypothetical protein